MRSSKKKSGTGWRWRWIWSERARHIHHPLRKEGIVGSAYARGVSTTVSCTTFSLWVFVITPMGFYGHYFFGPSIHPSSIRNNAAPRISFCPSFPFVLYDIVQCLLSVYCHSFAPPCSIITIIPHYFCFSLIIFIPPASSSHYTCAIMPVYDNLTIISLFPFICICGHGLAIDIVVVFVLLFLVSFSLFHSYIHIYPSIHQ
jgi:hypothetical protein